MHIVIRDRFLSLRIHRTSGRGVAGTENERRENELTEERINVERTNEQKRINEGAQRKREYPIFDSDAPELDHRGDQPTRDRRDPNRRRDKIERRPEREKRRTGDLQTRTQPQFGGGGG